MNEVEAWAPDVQNGEVRTALWTLEGRWMQECADWAQDVRGDGAWIASEVHSMQGCADDLYVW